MEQTEMYSPIKTESHPRDDSDETDHEIHELSPRNLLPGKYITLRNMHTDKLVCYQIEGIDIHQPVWETNKDLPDLVQDSTNKWLFLNDEDVENRYTHVSIAFTVIAMQIVTYMVLVWYLKSTVDENQQHREQNCYGPNCHIKEAQCMDIWTGAITGMLLVGFLWADILNSFAMIKESIFEDRLKDKWRFFGNVVILVEVSCAIFCGVVVGQYLEYDFDVINGAVGVLFVHDLDEKIYAAMCVTEKNWKKVLALIMWIFVSIIIAISVGCVYQNASMYFSGLNADCKENHFKCDSGHCVWQGFICNGVKNCQDGTDELNCNFELIQCPDHMFRCESTGECIQKEYVCDGWANCPDSSDEARDLNCSHHIADINCNAEGVEPTFQRKYKDDDWYMHIVDSGRFKCNNGQCIDAKFVCDGILDCVDLSDEFPLFSSVDKWPYMKECPYARLIKCPVGSVLCKTNGKCIQKLQICDGIDDCPDGADERQCPWVFGDAWCEFTDKFQCGGQIAKINDTHVILFENETVIEYSDYHDIAQYVGGSGSGRCLPMRHRCDGIRDCKDGLDEELCKYFECEENEKLCENGQCVPNQWICNHVPFCVDNQYKNGRFFRNCDYSLQPEPIECNELVLGSITKWFSRYDIWIPCPYKAAQFTTCNNYTTNFNTDMQVWDFPDWTMELNNDDAEWLCDINYFASTVTINSDKFICDQWYSAVIGPSNHLFSNDLQGGTYGFEVICSEGDF
eukprot:539414_1